MKKVAGIATYPPRISCLPETIHSLYDQVDEIYLCLNEFDTVPAVLEQMPKLNCIIPEKNYYDSGKFLHVSEVEGVYFACDDDLIYPPDYVDRTLLQINKYHRHAVVGYHGRVQHSGRKTSSYYRDAKALYHCLKKVPIDRRVHLLGTGALAFHTSTIQLNVANFKKGCMADIWFGLFALSQNVPLIVLQHEQGWIKHTERINVNVDTIYAQHCENDEQQTELVNSVHWKPLCDIPRSALPMKLSSYSASN